MIDRSQRHAARVFAIAYPLTVTLMAIAFTRWLAPILVWNHETETARNITKHLHDYRMFMGASCLNGVAGVVLLSALYLLLRPVNRGLALLAAFSRLVYVAMWFVQLLDSFGAVRILTGVECQGVLDARQLQALAALRLASGWDAYYIGLTFYGLSSLVLGFLFLQSRYVPRIVAWWGMLASFFEMTCAFAYLNDRGFGAVISANWYEMPVVAFELSVSIWFLTRGLKKPAPLRASPEPVERF
ncbi:MAG TPA: DUF4386 domain-containing protein [Terracidiphilus sp.]|nr:DUF4386 domain-containing protein [Terracidiphilus sp.]